MLKFLIFLIPVFLFSQEKITTTYEDQRELYLTVYNTNRALITEEREIDFKEKGKFFLNFMDVPSTIMSETLSFKVKEGKDLNVLEQNYEYDLLSPQKLLDKYLGKEVILVQNVMENNTTVLRKIKAKLLSTNNGTVWEEEGKILSNPIYSYLEYPTIPENLYARPTLVLYLEGDRGKRKVEASYLATGLNWICDYVLNLNEKGDLGVLIGWITLKNNSGRTYRDANLKLIAGDVKTVERKDVDALYEEVQYMKSKAPSFEEKPFFEYHLYTLQRKTTIKDNQQKQIELLEGKNIPIEREYVLRGEKWYYTQRYIEEQIQKVDVFLKFKNEEKSNLGISLPKGTVRVYQKDTDGSNQFIGEDLIDHTPKDEVIKLSVGRAFDIVSERKQRDFKTISSCVYEMEYEIVIRNHKEEDIVVKVVEPIGGDWTMVSNSHPFEKDQAFQVIFNVKVPKNGESKVIYKIRTKYC